MNDMRAVIVPKSDQINADTLLGGPLTITIEAVKIRPGTEQPVSIHYAGDDGKPYKPCKSMSKVMVTCWGPDANAYVGRSMTLYCDPAVTWGGMAVGGIRISHMSDIDGTQKMALTATKGSKKMFTVRPLVIEAAATKAAPTIADWINGTLAPAIAKCESVAELAKVQQSKGYLSVMERGTDDDRAAAKLLVDAAVVRLDVPADDPESEPVTADDGDIFPGDA